MRVLSWNINGIRRILANYKSCEEFVNGLEADIVCFQGALILSEITIQRVLQRQRRLRALLVHLKYPLILFNLIGPFATQIGLIQVYAFIAKKHH